MKELIYNILQEEIELKNNLQLSSFYINKTIRSLTIIVENEEREPDMEWDFTNIKKNIDKSTFWIKTKNQAIEYLKLLKEKIKNLDNRTRKRIIKYAIISLIGVIGFNNFSNLDTKQKSVEKILPIPGGGDTLSDTTKKYTRIRDYSENLVNHLKYEEGSITEKGEPVLVAYDIGDGAKTIGYGHAVFADSSRGDNGGKYGFLPQYDNIITGKTKITKKQAEILLKDDIDIAKTQLNRILDTWESNNIKPEITQNMYDAMISMIFNMGIGRFRSSEFIQYVKRGELENAKEQIKKESSNMFGKFPGLEERRKKESEMFGGQSIYI